MFRNIKVPFEYIILIIAWLFWGLSQSLLWYQALEYHGTSEIVITVALQTTTCIVINLISLFCLIYIRKLRAFYYKIILSILIVMFFSLLLAFINTSIYYYFSHSETIFQSLPLYLINASEKLIYLTGFCTMFFLIRNLAEFQKQKSLVEESRQTARDMQLQMLQQQLSPHFLFNSLNSLRYLISVDTEKARNMVTDLSDYLRLTLLSYKSIRNTVEEEINMLEYYLKIQKVRFEKDLEYCLNIDPKTRQFIVPKYILQPLVENAVNYGMQTSSMPLKLDISIFSETQVVKIVIKNTGRIMEPQLNGHSQNGIHNTTTRLELMFPDKAEFILKEDESWVSAEIIIHTSVK